MSAIGLAILFSASLSQSAPEPIKLRGLSRESEGAAVLTVGADGMIEKCQIAPRPYDNISSPPSLCGLFPAGIRYSPPATHKGRPQRREVTIRMQIYESNIR